MKVTHAVLAGWFPRLSIARSWFLPARATGKASVCWRWREARTTQDATQQSAYRSNGIPCIETASTHRYQPPVMLRLLSSNVPLMFTLRRHLCHTIANNFFQYNLPSRGRFTAPQRVFRCGVEFVVRWILFMDGHGLWFHCVGDVARLGA